MKVGIIAFSTNGCRLAQKVAEVFAGDTVELFEKTTMDGIGLTHVDCGMREWTEKAFGKYDAIVFIGAVGIAVREIAPFVKSKTVDPAVISMDDKGRFCIPVLSGHIGGANGLAVRIAGETGALAVVTTASDINGKMAIDSFAVGNGMSIHSLRIAKEVAARILAEDSVGLVCDVPYSGEIPKELSGPADSPTGVYIGKEKVSPFPTTLRLVPRDLVVGIGCKRGTPEETIEEMVKKALDEAGVGFDRIRALASIDLKKDEAGLLAFAAEHRLPITFYSSEELNALEGEFSKSEFVRSVTSVDCVCERSAVRVSDRGKLILKKFAGNGVTVAIAEEKFSVDFSKVKR